MARYVLKLASQVPFHVNLVGRMEANNQGGRPLRTAHLVLLGICAAVCSLSVVVILAMLMERSLEVGVGLSYTQCSHLLCGAHMFYFTAVRPWRSTWSDLLSCP